MSSENGQIRCHCGSSRTLKTKRGTDNVGHAVLTLSFKCTAKVVRTYWQNGEEKKPLPDIPINFDF